jgi:hypothetical protein
VNKESRLQVAGLIQQQNTSLQMISFAVVPFKLSPFQVHANGHVFLPLLEAPLELTFD